MVQVAHLTHRGHAHGQHLAHFAGRQAQQGVLALLGHQLGVSAGGAADLPALAGIELHIVEHRAHGDTLHGQSVAGLDVGSFAVADVDAGHDRIALL